MKVRRLFNKKARGLTITRLMARDGDRCHVCDHSLDRGIKDPHHPYYITFDHVIPRSKGGLTTFDNLKLAHRCCNRIRGNDPLNDEDQLP